MRKVILAAALAATFCLSQTSYAQQGSGGANTGQPAGGGLGGPPTTGSFSVQSQPQGNTGGTDPSGGVGGTGQVGGAGQQGLGAPGTGPNFMGTGDPAPGAATGPGQTFYGPGNSVGTEGAGTEGAGTGGAGTGGAAGGGTGEVTELASDEAQAELARLRAEVDRLSAELANVRAGEGSGTGGSGSEQNSEARPIASAVFEGRVNKVSKGVIEVIDRETGEPYVLRVDEDTRARRGERRIPVTRIREGSEVRASFDLIAGDTVAKQIDVLGKRRR
ncbi:hypothetical protein [Hyalangium sp.]|uniref:hypothetical protein n=1 Tax=Hyalangium sp. TaxID=2028555 RepID=UPI002D7065AB|nr:hypothetical protein [Hyalangium sp.]HYI00771.1 hypothetical protein [Hyalangium sp.]